jgi:hypothetical protein
MSIKQWLRNWLLGDGPKVVNMNYSEAPSLATASNRLDSVGDEACQLTFAVVKAMNGRIIKVSSYKPVQRGPDWTHELYIVKDDEKIPDVIARIMAIKALEQ